MSHPPAAGPGQQFPGWPGAGPSATPPAAGSWSPEPPRNRTGLLIALVLGAAAVLVALVAVVVIALLLRNRDTAEDQATPSSSGAPPLAAVEPCTLISAEDAQTLGLTGQEPKKLGKARVCRWTHEGPTRSASYDVQVTIWDQGTPDQLPGVTGKRPITIGSHSGITGQGGLRTGCLVALLVGQSSILEVEFLGGEDDALACDLATRVITVIEPKLP